MEVWPVQLLEHRIIGTSRSICIQMNWQRALQTACSGLWVAIDWKAPKLCNHYNKTALSTRDHPAPCYVCELRSWTPHSTCVGLINLVPVTPDSCCLARWLLMTNDSLGFRMLAFTYLEKETTLHTVLSHRSRSASCFMIPCLCQLTSSPMPRGHSVGLEPRVLLYPLRPFE